MRKAGEARDAAGPPQLFDVVEGMTDGLVAVDREWRITYVNAATVEASGTAREVLLGADHWESFPTRVGTALERDLRRVMTERVPIRSESLDEAEGRWYEVSVYPLGGDGVAYYRRDVTERRLADATHRKLERERDELLGRLQLHYERMPIACIVADNQQHIVDWNPAAERVFGYTREEVVGVDGYKLLVAPASSAVADAVIARLAAGEVAPNIVAENLAKDGRIVVCEWYNTPLRDRVGDVIGFMSMALDITAQKQAEDRLRRSELLLAESEAKFRTLADVSPAIIWSVDETGGVRAVNQPYVNFFGVSLDDVAGDGWQGLLHPDDTPAFMAEYSAAIRERRPLLMRTRVRRHDQRWRWMETRAMPHLGEDGRYLGHVGLCLDISDQIETTAFLLESEKNLAAELAGMARLQEVSTRLVQTGDSTSLLEHIVDAAIAITAADMGSIQLYHPESASLRVVASRGLGHPFLDHFGAIKQGQGACGTAMQTGERIVIEDATATTLLPAGDLTVVLATGIRAMQSTPLVTRSGQLVGMLTTYYRAPGRPAGRDLRVLDLLARQAADWIERRITQAERDQLLASEREARAESERAAHLKDEFLATLSHELRTPLSAILGWADVLRENLHDAERVRRGVEVIRRNAWAQAQLIGDLLDLSRVITGKMRLNVEQVVVGAVIDSAIEAVRPAADARRISILSVIEPIEAPVHGDSARLRQILWNLLSNAVKFTPEDGRVEVALSKVGRHIEISVSDTGKGIAADFLPHVFQRFRQADASASREHGGLGIGLALVKQITELHGGHVRAASPGEGLGSTFTVRLPMAVVRTQDQEPDRAPVPASAMLVDQEAPALDGVRVLVLDDQADALELIQHVLEDRQVAVSAFQSVNSALEALETQQFDVLLSDIGMPRRDGYDFMIEVRRRGITTPAAALTAFARSEDRTRALLSGYQAHLAKPLETFELVATVASLSGRVGH